MTVLDGTTAVDAGGLALPGTRGVPWSARDAITSAALVFSPAAAAFAPARATLAELREFAGLPSGYLADLVVNRRLYNGDHWLDGNGWKGPWPELPEGASKETAEGMQALHDEILRGFTPVNKIAEVSERHTNGVVGTEPTWTWTPDGIRVRRPGARRMLGASPAIAPPPQPGEPAPAPADDGGPAAAAERARVAQAIEQHNARCTKWWDARNCGELFQSFTRSLLYGRVSSLRVHVPASAFEPETTLRDDGSRRATGRLLLVVRDVDDALGKIHVEQLDADVGRVVRDRQTHADVGVRFAKRGESTIAHVTYLDENGRTVMAVVDAQTNVAPESGAAAPAQAISFDLGGRLLMFTGVREAFVTEQVRQAQFAVNYANSMIPRNVTTAGFADTIITNAEVHGRWVPRDGGGRDFIADPIPRGPGVINVVQGKLLEDANGAETLATPGIHDRSPVDPTPTIKAKREHYRDILEECDQVHVLMEGDATASGVSRVQARADHLNSMGLTKVIVERAGRWLLETVTALAHALAQPGGDGAAAIAGLRVSFSCFLDPGPLDAGERAQNTADVAAGTLSVETCIERNGISDVDAELERVEHARAVDLETKRAAIFAAWMTAGVDESFAAYRAGLTAEDARRLTQGFEPPPAPAPFGGGSPANNPGSAPPAPPNRGNGGTNGGGGNAGNAGNGARSRRRRGTTRAQPPGAP